MRQSGFCTNYWDNKTKPVLVFQYCYFLITQQKLGFWMILRHFCLSLYYAHQCSLITIKKSLSWPRGQISSFLCFSDKMFCSWELIPNNIFLYWESFIFAKLKSNCPHYKDNWVYFFYKIHYNSSDINFLGGGPGISHWAWALRERM